MGNLQQGQMEAGAPSASSKELYPQRLAIQWISACCKVEGKAQAFSILSLLNSSSSFATLVRGGGGTRLLMDNGQIFITLLWIANGLYGLVEIFYILFEMKRKSDLEYKHKLKGSSSRQGFKLEALNTAANVRKGSSQAIQQNGKKMDSLYKGDNSKSTLLRQLKAHSLKIQEEHCDQPPPPPRSILQKLDNNDRRKQQNSLQGKDNCRSFMIRKKNLSSYARKLEEDLTKYQIDLLALPHEHILEPQSHSNTNSSHDIKDALPQPLPYHQQKQLLRSSLLNHTSGLKIKPIICKPLREQDRSTSREREENSSKMQKQIQKMIKKVRNSSKSEYQAASTQLHRPANNKKSDPLVPLEGKSKQGKGFNGCKTIRIDWGKQNMDRVGDLPDRDDVFGGISVITHCRQAQIQSLKQLFKQLNHNHADVPTVLSKEFLEF